jgi:hypothetical protein
MLVYKCAEKNCYEQWNEMKLLDLVVWILSELINNSTCNVFLYGHAILQNVGAVH